MTAGSVDQRRDDARRRMVAALRSSTLLDGSPTRSWPDLETTIGASRQSLLMLFPHEDDLLDALNENLVAEASERLRSVTGAEPEGTDPAEAVRSLVRAVVRSRPLDRSGLLARLERRTRDLRRLRETPTATHAERRFLAVLHDDIARLLATVGLTFSAPGAIVSRALLNSYERAFESWLIQGRDEADFEHSRFATETLPALVLAMSRPLPSTATKESP